MSIKKIEKIDPKEQFLKLYQDFESSLNGHKKIPFYKTRQNAISRFSEVGLPTRKWEEWKYTNIDPILRHDFGLAPEEVRLSEPDIAPYLIDGLEKNLLVFVNGRIDRQLSNCRLQNSGIVIDDLRSLFASRPELIQKYISKIADYSDSPFAALNTAFTLEGVFISIPNDTVMEEPLHVIHISVSGEQPFQSHPRNVIVVGKGSRLSVVETHHHLKDGVYLNNPVTEVLIKENAIFDHTVVQDESKNAYRISNLQINQAAGSTYNAVNIDFGGSIVRNDHTIRIDGENCESNLAGFYLLSGNQHVDNHTNIEHLKPHCNSNELFKGILSDKARGVFSGTIYVARDAQKTNAFQSNKNLLLSDEAEIDSKPQLKIFADDVKCSHGATIGQLDEEALFYLRQRGISEENAHFMLHYAFGSDVFDKIEIPGVREKIDSYLGEKFKSDINKL